MVESDAIGVVWLMGRGRSDVRRRRSYGWASCISQPDCRTLVTREDRIGAARMEPACRGERAGRGGRGSHRDARACHLQDSPEAMQFTQLHRFSATFTACTTRLGSYSASRGRSKREHRRDISRRDAHELTWKAESLRMRRVTLVYACPTQAQLPLWNIVL